jgi:hypothetical protein
MVIRLGRLGCPWKQLLRAADNHVGLFGASECLEAPNLFVRPRAFSILSLYVVGVWDRQVGDRPMCYFFFYLLSPRFHPWRAGLLSCGSLHIGDESRGSAPPTDSFRGSPWGRGFSDNPIHVSYCMLGGQAYAICSLPWAQYRRRKVQVSLTSVEEHLMVMMRHAPATATLEEETGSLDELESMWTW